MYRLSWHGQIGSDNTEESGWGISYREGKVEVVVEVTGDRGRYKDCGRWDEVGGYGRSATPGFPMEV